MGEFFKSNTYFRDLYKYKDLPIYETDEFDFYRCVPFDDAFYRKNVSTLHDGNLRYSPGRYSKLFPGQKLSYWADSPATARAEVKKHNKTNNLLTFWAYDDSSSTFPTMGNDEILRIVDGRKFGLKELIDKIDKGLNISADEKRLMESILEQSPDCLVYDSVARKGGENFIFLERGFKKLAIREVRLRLGNRKAKNEATILCAGTSDYSPYLEKYACFFEPIARVGMDKSYFNSEEYLFRKANMDVALERLSNFLREKRGD